MRRVLQELERLKQSLLEVEAHPTDVCSTVERLVEPYIRAIKRKCAIVITHHVTCSTARPPVTYVVAARAVRAIS